MQQAQLQLDRALRGELQNRAQRGAAKPGDVMGKQEVLQNGGIVEPGGSRGGNARYADVGFGGSELGRGEEGGGKRGKQAEETAVRADGGRERELEKRLVEVAVEPGEMEGKRGKRPR